MDPTSEKAKIHNMSVNSTVVGDGDYMTKDIVNTTQEPAMHYLYQRFILSGHAETILIVICTISLFFLVSYNDNILLLPKLTTCAQHYVFVLALRML